MHTLLKATEDHYGRVQSQRAHAKCAETLERLHKHRTNRARLSEEIAVTARSGASSRMSITQGKLERSSTVMRDARRSGPAELRRA